MSCARNPLNGHIVVVLQPPSLGYIFLPLYGRAGLLRVIGVRSLSLGQVWMDIRSLKVMVAYLQR
jgi:hypothetical protein